MRQKFDIYGDKEHITQVNVKYVFFRFSDGTEGRIKPQKKELQEVLKWLNDEMAFYHRMYEEIHKNYEIEKEEFDKTQHFYSEEEIHAACLKNRFANIDMELSNKNYLEKWHHISGRRHLAQQANDKYWKLYKVAAQIKNVLCEL